MKIEWRTDPEWHTANRAEQAFVGEHELVAFDLPEGEELPAEIGWEVFGGPNRQEQLATGRAETFEEAKAAAEAAWQELIEANTGL